MNFLCVSFLLYIVCFEIHSYCCTSKFSQPQFRFGCGFQKFELCSCRREFCGRSCFYVCLFQENKDVSLVLTKAVRLELNALS